MKDIHTAIGRLRGIDWFSRVGFADSIETRMSVTYVPSWSEAITRHGQIETANAFDEGRALLTRELSAHHRAEYRKWNKLVAGVRNLLDTEIWSHLDKSLNISEENVLTPSEVDLRRTFIDWDLIHFVMEDAYSDLVPGRFYTTLLNVYGAGHYPCGWDEKWPNGQLWVF